MNDNSINIIGCGRLGKTLGRLFVQKGPMSSVSTRNRSDLSSSKAVEFIGAGHAAPSIGALPPARLWMLGVPDEEISVVASALVADSQLRANDIVFHCSGALSSEKLAPLRIKGALIASVHPIRSFADSELAARHFHGTRCAFEGDGNAREPLARLFQSIGGMFFEVATDAKLLLHAGHVFASNYVVAVLECANRLYAEAGIDPEVSREFSQPLVMSVAENVGRLGTVSALTGPIARGESDLVSAQLQAVRSSLPAVGELYARLGEVAADLAERQGLSGDRVRETRRILAKGS